MTSVTTRPKSGWAVATIALLALLTALMTTTVAAQTTTTEQDTNGTVRSETTVRSDNDNERNDNNDRLFGGTRLRDLIILDAVFGGNVGVSGTTVLGGSILGGTTFGGSQLGELILLSELFDDDEGTEDDEDLFSDLDLEDLIILDSLFAGGSLNLLGTTNVVGTTNVAANAQFVVVQRGDTLSSIARRFLGDAGRANEIAALNGIANPNLIFPGQVLRLPPVTVSTSGTVGTNLGVGGRLGDLILLREIFDDDND